MAKATELTTSKAVPKKEEMERKKRLAFTLYVDNGFEQKIISEITGISEKSISKWKKDGDWDSEKQAANLGPDKVMRRLMKMYDAILKEIEGREPAIPNSKEGDILSKLADAAKKLQGEMTMFVKAEVGKGYIAYIQQTHGQAKAVEVVELWHEYLMATS